MNDSCCTVPIIHWGWLSFVNAFDWCVWGWTLIYTLQMIFWFPCWVPHICLKARTLMLHRSQIFHISTVKCFLGFLLFYFITVAVTCFQKVISIWNNTPYRNNVTILNGGRQVWKSMQNLQRKSIDLGASEIRWLNCCCHKISEDKHFERARKSSVALS